jgi:hypothetical protein
MAERTTPDPTQLLSRLVLAALILTAGVVLSRRFLSPPAPRTQAGGGLKPLAIPLHQIDTAAHATAPEGDAPDPGASPADLVRTHVFATLTESEALALPARIAHRTVFGCPDYQTRPILVIWAKQNPSVHNPG